MYGSLYIIDYIILHFSLLEIGVFLALVIACFLYLKRNKNKVKDFTLYYSTSLVWFTLDKIYSGFYYFGSSIDMSNITDIDLRIIAYLSPRIKKFLKNRKSWKSERLTPHLTIYYPLETALVSVLIRFMGVLLLFLIILIIGVSALCSLYNYYFFSLIFKIIFKKVIFFIILVSMFVHINKVYSHF